MRQAFVVFGSLQPDEMREFLALGDLWCSDTIQNKRSFGTIKAVDGLFQKLGGGYSLFSEDDDAAELLEEVAMHYSPHSFIGPYSGPLDCLRIFGCQRDVVARVFADQSHDISAVGLEIRVGFRY